jgi:hypothetical protein
VGQYKVQTPNGNKTKYIYFKIRKDAAARLAKAIADRDSGLVFDYGSLTMEKDLVHNSLYSVKRDSASLVPAAVHSSTLLESAL